MSRKRSVLSIPLLLVTVFMGGVAQQAQAEDALVTCTIDGTGSYVFDPATQTDYYDWSGQLDQCTSISGDLQGLTKGVFQGTGEVRTLEGFTGPGTQTIIWENKQASVMAFTMAGIPEHLVLNGEMREHGVHGGSSATMHFYCKVKDTGKCFQLGSGAWDFVGTLEILV